MKTLEYAVRFNTPAFLGNAEQNGQWRTPPFKALLRQWWRVAYAAAQSFQSNEAAMRRTEGLLFGNAWLENQFCKSKIRLRLDRWDEGQLKKNSWQSLATVSHPEVPRAVASDLYLGYGPVTLPHGTSQPTLKSNAAIQAGETATLSIAVPETETDLIEQALTLMHLYGTAGGRSRNGWGSFDLLPSSARGRWAGCEGVGPLRPWREALSRDWPHSIGRDDSGALVWQTAPVADWKVLMKLLAQIKIGLRTQFKFTTGKNAPHTEERHWISYPITNHSVAAWDGNKRLPNSLRFKVRQTADGQLVGVIFHVPCLPPAEFHPDRPAIERVWHRVHAFLDASAQHLNRIPA